MCLAESPSIHPLSLQQDLGHGLVAIPFVGMSELFLDGFLEKWPVGQSF
jgi:hypothetical protein